MKKIVLTCLLILCAAGVGNAAPVTVDTLEELTEAIADPGSGDITVSGTITMGSDPLSNDLKILRDVTISGGTLDGGGFPIFTVRNNARVSFDSLVFTGAQRTGSGGAVTVESGNVSVTGNTSFINNSATVNGGAINLAGGTLNFTGNPQFENNQAASGGAINISASSTTVNLTDVTFTGNKATTSGGAVNATGAVTLSGGTFNGNTVPSGNGGAVASGGDVTASNGTFTSNTASTSGGAIYTTGAVTLNGGTFTSNKALGGSGGAVSTTGAVTLSGGTFNTNTASAGGGAISAGSLNAAAVTFGGNEAGASGGAISATGAVTLNGGNFTSNKALSGSGGAVSTTGAVTLSGNGTFNTNTASAGGGAISAGSVSAATGVTFKGNGAGTTGGAINATGAVTLTANQFTENKAGAGDGGAIYNNGDGTFTNCLFSKNVSGANTGATGSGGAVSCGGKFIAIKCTFSDNEANTNGGAAYVRSTVTDNRVERCVFNGNSTPGNGGALHVAEETSTTSFLSSLFSANVVTETGEGGGAVYIGGTGVFNSCTFTKNTAGAINATTPVKGGAVYAESPASGSVSFTNCTFTQNQASSLNSDGMGGAIYIVGKGDMRYCTVIDKNEAFASLSGKGFGGGIYIESGPFSITACAVSGNTAAYGDDIFRRENVIITTGGYNRLRYYGIISQALGTSYPTEFSWRGDGNVRGAPDYDQEGVTQISMFGSVGLTANTNEFINVAALEIGCSGALSSLTTVALLNDRSNPALDQVPYREGTLFAVKSDQRGSPRPQPDSGFFDVGAFEASKNEGASDSPIDEEYVDSVKMGGIPNRMTKVGERCSLVATVFPTRAKQEVTWESSNGNVADVDQYGNLSSLSVGTTTITVTTVSKKPNGEHATDSVVLKVAEGMDNVDVDPGVGAKLTSFNANLRQYGEQVYFADADPATVNAASFQSAFKNAYGVAPSQVRALPDANAIVFSSTPSYTGNSWFSAKPSIGVSLSELPIGGGSLLPLEYTWSMGWDEVSTIMGSPVTQVTAEALFRNLKLVFEGADGVTMPVVDVDGEYGIAVSRAISSGALEMTNGNNGLTLRLSLMLGDVPASSSGAPSLIGNNLVVADGVANGTASGAMWLLKRTDGGGSAGGTGGGGGCNGGFGAVFLALASAFALRQSTSGRKFR